MIPDAGCRRFPHVKTYGLMVADNAATCTSAARWTRAVTTTSDPVRRSHGGRLRVIPLGWGAPAATCREVDCESDLDPLVPLIVLATPRSAPFRTSRLPPAWQGSCDRRCRPSREWKGAVTVSLEGGGKLTSGSVADLYVGLSELPVEDGDSGPCCSVRPIAFAFSTLPRNRLRRLPGC